MATTPRVSQRFSVQTTVSSSSASSHMYGAAPASVGGDAGSAASYSFAGGDALPPAFSSRRTSASVLSSAASSAHQSALFSPTTSSHRNTFPTASGAGSRTASTASTATTPGLAGRIASFTSYDEPAPSASAAAPDILERPRDKTRTAEVSLSSLSFLFSEMVSYTQNRVTGVTDLEKRLSLIGYTIGQRVLGMAMHRQEMTSNAKNPKRETRLLPTLLWIHTGFWKAAFGRPADSLERSTEAGRSDEYMISTNVPTFSKSICVPNDMSQLSVEAITAGMVEAALDGLGFPARVTAHTVATPQFPSRTTILIKLDKCVMDREDALAST
ncbi:related to TRS31-TRAPP subunit of 31 kDa involved in targeting and fusion of ER to golgi transport vesicles [Sporisorium reilianum f. sp. reilianum]|uniref:Related to TRS31-TRAPP subunit of 31 kDa involved in targeting and fusion of ER to golgi transport vesicles n=1 Tax=Sporisorium reilianum f. sp. reilianum TaxID=72559 RepID=A0A2N8UL11_9BASI|nr:related to TRS31-TRAPP subunit of 31 kDa involved in targeting and fusion of ER to golgi transport vesicles [Sporisorium reilianum f. sp. reilianum]